MQASCPLGSYLLKGESMEALKQNYPYLDYPNLFSIDFLTQQ